MAYVNEPFNNQNISKYFKNQTPQIGELNSFYKDSFFPSDKISIYGTGKTFEERLCNLGVNKEKVEWKRISEMQNFKDFSMFPERLEVPNSNWTSSLSSPLKKMVDQLSKYPQLILNLFRKNEVNNFGYYELCLFIDGDWQIVIVDDTFPMLKIEEEDKISYELLFSNADNNSIWFILLEKAWAKVNEAYSNIYDDSSTLDLFHSLTGFPYEHVSILRDQREQLWNKIKSGIDHEYLIYAMNSKAKEKYLQNNGLVSGVFYHIIDYRECVVNRESLRLLVVRNLKDSQWLGVWSENSHRWSEETRAQLKRPDDVDCFYIDFDDLIFSFSSFNICKILNFGSAKSIFTENLMEEVNSPPHVYNLYLSEASEVDFSLLAQNWRFNRTLMSPNLFYPFFFTIARFNEKKNTFTYIHSKYSYKHSDIHLNLSLEGGIYVIWVYTNIENCSEPKPQNYSLRVISSSTYFNFTKIPNGDKDFSLISEIIKSSVYQDNSGEIDSWPDDLYFKSKSQFGKSGIGYLFINNNTSLKDYKIDLDTSEIENMIIIKPSTNSIIVNKMSKCLILGIVKNPNERFSFNISRKSSYINTTKVKETFDAKSFVDSALKNSDFNNSVDKVSVYTLNGVLNQNLGFKSYKYLSEKAKYDVMTKLFPELVDLVNRDDVETNKKLKIVIREEFENGFYTGQKNTRTGKKEGVGVYLWNSGEKYIGNWADDLQDGFGMQIDKKGEVMYKGNYKKSLKNEGRFRLLNGDIYDGEFEDDAFSGLGSYTWIETGVTWKGTFENDQPSGMGVLILPDGTTQQREFK